jgi:hypothetical protein
MPDHQRVLVLGIATHYGTVNLAFMDWQKTRLTADERRYEGHAAIATLVTSVKAKVALAAIRESSTRSGVEAEVKHLEAGTF